MSLEWTLRLVSLQEVEILTQLCTLRGNVTAPQLVLRVNVLQAYALLAC